MQDPFTGYPTCLRGRRLPEAEERRRLQDDHERRLEALARLCALAAKCGVATDPDRDIVTVPEDANSLLELSDPTWADLGEAIRAWRTLVPLRSLGEFGFPDDATISLEDASPRLQYLYSGVEASAFVSREDHSIYKFYRPVEGEEKRVGSTFGFHRGDEHFLQATAHPGNYSDLFDKLLLIDALGMPTEVLGITPEGVVVTKQALGDPLPQGADVSAVLPAPLIAIPGQYLRADRDHPRLYLRGERAWLVADLHARNFVRAEDGRLHIIDLVAARWPSAVVARDPVVGGWFRRVQADPAAPVLAAAADDEL